MQLLDKDIKKTKIKLSDEQLYELVDMDKQEAERYFSTYLAEPIIKRYQMLHSSDEYYSKRFPKLHPKCGMASSDIKDVVEWLMPSFTEVFFGADKIIGIFGRTPDDDPEVLEKVIQYQTQTQNNGYVIMDQWIRDALESGLGVIRLEWEHRERKVINRYLLTAEEFYNMDATDTSMITKAEEQPDGTFIVKVKEIEVTKDQAVMNNVRPGSYIYIPDKNEDDRMVFECERKRVLYDDLLKMAKLGIYENIEDIDLEGNLMDATSMDAVFDAMRDYEGEKPRSTNDYTDASNGENQTARKIVTVYDCWGYYDVNGDGLLEPVHVITCNDKIIFKEVNELERSPFFHISFYANSYQTWKIAVADFLKEVQDLKTALMEQITINTTINNDRSFAVDSSQVKAIDDIESGRKNIRFDLKAGRSIADLMVPMPQYQLPRECFTLLEMVNTLSEQKTGITKYNQGLDSSSLNKTATGISRIMEASQQRMRKMARDGAENGIVPLYKHLIKLDKKFLKEDFTFRLTNQYYEFKPDDINGEFDVQVTSNIGLQDKQLTVQNLMLMFTQILPNLLQLGAASPQGMWETATQIIKEMGFNNPDKYIGVQANMASMLQAGNMIVQMLPQLMMRLGQQLGLNPQQTAVLAQTLAQAIQQQLSQQAQQQQQMIPPENNPQGIQVPSQQQSAAAINQVPTSEQSLRERGIFR